MGLDEHCDHKGKTISYDEINGKPPLPYSYGYITRNLACHSSVKKNGYHALYSESWLYH